MIRRWLSFSSVGILGFAVQFVALLTLAGALGVNYLLATAIATSPPPAHRRRRRSRSVIPVCGTVSSAEASSWVER